jgi:hypothetical protein
MSLSLEIEGLAPTFGVSFFRSLWAIAFQDVRVTRDFQESFVTLVRRGPALRTALCEAIPKTFAFFASNYLSRASRICASFRAATTSKNSLSSGTKAGMRNSCETVIARVMVSSFECVAVHLFVMNLHSRGNRRKIDRPNTA